jgi:muramidase (phage lysozyme)
MSASFWGKAAAAAFITFAVSKIRAADVVSSGADYLIDYEDADMAYTSKNSDPVSALLFAIRSSENKSAWLTDEQKYGMFYGNVPFFDFSEHPILSGELTPTKLPDYLCRAAGYSAGCVTTAAGAYQITAPTWKEFRAASKGYFLHDFSRESQDECARRILEATGALALLAAGNVPAAITRASSRWASLPGSTAKQNPLEMDAVMAFYNAGIQNQG